MSGDMCGGHKWEGGGSVGILWGEAGDLGKHIAWDIPPPHSSPQSYLVQNVSGAEVSNSDLDEHQLPLHHLKSIFSTLAFFTL